VESSGRTHAWLRETGERIRTVNDYPHRADLLEVNEADDGLVVYDPTHDQVHHLNPSASMIFDLCDGTRDAEAIAQILAEAYELDTPPLEDSLAGLEELANRNLIRYVSHGDEPS
jgi:hypothetical protein